MPLPVERQFQIFARDNFTCQYCGWRAGEDFDRWYIAMLEVDHIVSTTHGGSDDEHNLITACHACNHYKGDLVVHSVEEARQWLAEYRAQVLRPWWDRHVAASVAV